MKKLSDRFFLVLQFIFIAKHFFQLVHDLNWTRVKLSCDAMRTFILLHAWIRLQNPFHLYAWFATVAILDITGYFPLKYHFDTLPKSKVFRKSLDTSTIVNMFKTLTSPREQFSIQFIEFWFNFDLAKGREDKIILLSVLNQL